MSGLRINEKPCPSPVVEPATGVLKIGVKYAGGVHREFEIGPLTDDAEIRAMAEYPDSIDFQLIVHYLIERDTPPDKRPANYTPLTNKERNAARRMLNMSSRINLRYRVTRLGGIPPEDIAAAAALLSPEDMGALRLAADEVDERLDRFRDENAANLETSNRAGGGGSAGGPAGENVNEV